MLLGLPLFTLLHIIVAQSPQLDPDTLQKIIQRTVALHQKWGPQMSSPSASVEAKEMYRHPGEGQTVVAYHLFVKGLPASKNYNLLQMNIATGQVATNMQGVTFDKNGLAICAGRPDTCGDPDTPDDPIDFILPSQKGESHHLALVSEDGQSKVFFLITPFPVIGADHGCTVELSQLMLQAALVYVSASGFTANEKLKFKSASEIESHDKDVQADASGNYNIALLPAVKGIASGTLQVTVSGKSCAPTASMDWGPASMHNE
ncbi:MAG: hypothetical protein ABSG69_09795 [Candidatus Acidiferrum sp.]|jgi:hypothetical protein